MSQVDTHISVPRGQLRSRLHTSGSMDCTLRGDIDVELTLDVSRSRHPAGTCHRQRLLRTSVVNRQSTSPDVIPRIQVQLNFLESNYNSHSSRKMN